MEKIPVLFVLGPTGAGKTGAAVRLARDLDGEVVNFDSRQVYRSFPIITAQPSPEEKAACVHRLYGFLDTEQKITAGKFMRLAKTEAADIHSSGRVPILVGGTGLYMRSFLQGLAPIPEIPPELSQQTAREVEEVGPAEAHARLKSVDPDYAAKIHPNDRQRIARALEVHRATGVALSRWHERAVEAGPYRALKIGMKIELKDLAPLLERRIKLMLAQGALEEARQAMAECADPSAPGWSGIGCAELFRCLAGEISLEQAVVEWLKNTRAYAKRQMTWFKKDPEIEWFDPGDLEAIGRRAAEFLGRTG